MPVELIRSPEHDRARSLGWLATRWIEALCVHGPGDIEGRPLDITQPDAIPLSDELASLTVDCYTVDPSGRRLYDSAFYSRPKGADKSGHAARIALFEALGPCRFAGWAEGGEVYEFMDFQYVFEPGEPLGRPVTYPFLRIMATEEGQTGNVYDAVHYNLENGPLREAFSRRDDVGLTRVFLPDGGEIRPSTASSSAKDGGKETWINFDETHLYDKPELRRMYGTVRRNLAKRKEAEPWSFESSTMYEPGADSIAERSHNLARRIREGKVRRPRMLFDHRFAPPDVDLADEASLLAGLREAYGDAASYMDFDRLISEIWDPRNEVADSRRFFLNQVVAHEQAWIAPVEWDALAKPDYTVAAGEQVTLGFDGSKSDDHCALIGCEVETGHIFTLGVWDPQAHEPHRECEFGRCGEAPRDAIDATVRAAHRRFDVVGFFSDLHPWESYVDRWAEDLAAKYCVKPSPKHAVAWDMRARQRETTQMVESFHDAVVEGELSHDGDPRLSQHIYNTRRRPGHGGGVTFGKESPESPKKVDGAAAASLARKARQDYLALPDSRKRRKKTGRAAFV